MYDEILRRAKLLACDHAIRYIFLKRADRLFKRFRDVPVQQRRRAESSEVRI